ncbi:MAG: glycosyltransferase family 39 protein [Candidatus Pacearchaeota archaeon]|jgi:4-amino-4-deoxy-L-arabinose transferase-like glycosyltransferase
MENNQVLEKETNKFIKWVKNPYNFTLGLIILFAIGIRIYYFILTKIQPLWWDEAEYFVLARHWAGLSPHLGYVFDPVRQVLNPFLMSLFFRLFGVGEFLPRIFLLILSIASVIGMYFLGKELFDKKVGLLSCFFMSIFWVNLFFSFRVLVDIHSLTFFIFSAFFFYKYLNTGSKSSLYWATALIGIGTLFKLSTAFLLPAILLYLLITERLTFLKKKEIWIAALIFILILTPYLLWGYFQFHGFILTQASGLVAPDNYFSNGFTALKNYLILFPNYLSWIMLFVFILGLASMYELLLGFDLLVKQGDIKLKKDLYLLLILIIPLILISIMIDHTEDRYILNVFPAIFIISSCFIIKVFYLVKKKNKIIAIILLILLLGFSVQFQLKSTDSLIEGKIYSYLEVKEAGLWINQNSNPSDLIATNSNPQIKYYADREIVQIPNTEEEFEQILNSTKNLRYFVISSVQKSPDWAYQYPTKQGLTPVNGYFSDPEKQQAVLLVYEL